MQPRRKFKRRHILGAGAVVAAGAAVGLDPVRGFLSSMVRGFIRDAGHQATAAEARNYIKIHLYGSPSRWLFDNPLRPGDTDGFFPNPAIINKLTHVDSSNSQFTRGVYADTKVQGINMPYLWNFTVPSAAGGERPLAPLLNNMLIIRGCDMNINGHPANAAKLVAPVQGGPSLTALVAERSRASIPAISVGRTPSNRAYRSPMGIGVVEIPPEHESYGEFLLQAFLKSGEASFRDDKNLDAAITEALGELESYSRTNAPGSTALYRERERADRLIRRGVDEMGQAYPAIVAKYLKLVQAAFNGPVIPGVTDAALPGLKFPYAMDGKLETIEMVANQHFEGYVFCEDDLVKCLNQAKLHGMAERFAIAEFALLNRLSSSILVAPSTDMGNVLDDVVWPRMASFSDIQRVYDEKTNRTTLSYVKPLQEHRSGMNLDSHRTGILPNLVSCTLYYRALGACMLELQDQIKAANLFDETVVHLSSEFERIPSPDGAALHHNFRAHMTSVISGIVKEPTVIGNILVGSKNDRGTSGIAAPTKGVRDKIIKIENVSSTLSQMLRVPSIVPRAHPLIDVENDKVKPRVEWARNVEGEMPYEEEIV